MLPPAIVVHGLSHARAALRPGRPVTLLSAPGAGVFAGAGWWRGVVGQALGETGAEAGEAWPDVLDCGDAPGRALEALAVGCRRVILLPCPAFASVVERAAGALVLATRPPSLDLAPLDLRQARALARIEAWLETGQ